MKKTYDEFLKSFSIIDEDSFYKLMSSFSDNIDIDFNEIEWTNPCSEYDIVFDIISNILETNWECVYIDGLTLDEQSISLGDVSCIKDLEEIKNALHNWTITNYEELKSDLELSKKEEAEIREIYELMDEIKNNASIEQLREFVKNL